MSCLRVILKYGWLHCWPYGMILHHLVKFISYQIIGYNLSAAIALFQKLLYSFTVPSINTSRSTPCEDIHPHTITEPENLTILLGQSLRYSSLRRRMIRLRESPTYILNFDSSLHIIHVLSNRCAFLPGFVSAFGSDVFFAWKNCINLFLFYFGKTKFVETIYYYLPFFVPEHLTLKTCPHLIADSWK